MSFSSVRVGAPVTQQIISGSRASCISNCRRLPSVDAYLSRCDYIGRKDYLTTMRGGSEVTPELAYCPHPPPGIDWCIIFQTNHLPTVEFARSWKQRR